MGSPWELGVELAIHDADTVWNTFVGEMGLSHQGTNVSNKPQTTVLLPEYFIPLRSIGKLIRNNNYCRIDCIYDSSMMV